MTCEIEDQVKAKLMEWEKLHAIIEQTVGVSLCYQDVCRMESFHVSMKHVATEITKKLGSVAEIKWFHPVTENNPFDECGYFAVVNKNG